MNNLSPAPAIRSHTELDAERKRLEGLIEMQKNIIRVDIDRIKEELKEEMRPALEAANFVKKVTTKETRNETMISIGSNVLIDLIIRKVFSKSNILIQMIVPTLVKNYSTHAIFSLMKSIAQKRQNGRTHRHIDY
jgi:hypothetical protein